MVEGIDFRYGCLQLLVVWHMNLYWSEYLKGEKSLGLHKYSRHTNIYNYHLTLLDVGVWKLNTAQGGSEKRTPLPPYLRAPFCIYDPNFKSY